MALMGVEDDQGVFSFSSSRDHLTPAPILSAVNFCILFT